ncbi:YtxH domain-containing protein [Mangrovivirga sp. M17]|uniref:YtxH domain-containing protein n=1 Tax=Mangrovivirga halotolerans TaxID=2993936 RepID=A0ABT3RSA1_9BACT|nr:YtxH domain-containing protein [Mangrovivirga halotolerans]MCX2744664.1 YtxH domain-containing protein [Mangrovivirga halotolerans]
MKSNNLLAFLTGMASGALIGILFAPDKGSNTRDRVTYQLDRYKQILEELIDDLVEGKVEHANQAKTDGEKVVSDAKNKAEQLLDDVDELLGQLKKK